MGIFEPVQPVLEPDGPGRLFVLRAADGEQVPQSVSRVLRIRGQERPAPHTPEVEA